jgi:hypothetical protein
MLTLCLTSTFPRLSVEEALTLTLGVMLAVGEMLRVLLREVLGLGRCVAEEAWEAPAEALRLGLGEGEPL